MYLEVSWHILKYFKKYPKIIEISQSTLKFFECYEVNKKSQSILKYFEELWNMLKTIECLKEDWNNLNYKSIWKYLDKF